MKTIRAIRNLLSGAVITGSMLVSPANAEKTSQTLDFDTLAKINAHCMKQALDAEYTVAIAIYDQGGVLLSFNQVTGAAPATGEVARWKGLSAAMYRATTLETSTWNVPTAPKIATIQGGAPIFSKEGISLGGIGVAGAPPEFDENCGTAAMQSVGFLSKSPS